jgi:hypothetical protein
VCVPRRSFAVSWRTVAVDQTDCAFEGDLFVLRSDDLLGGILRSLGVA